MFRDVRRLPNTQPSVNSAPADEQLDFNWNWASAFNQRRKSGEFLMTKAYNLIIVQNLSSDLGVWIFTIVFYRNRLKFVAT